MMARNEEQLKIVFSLLEPDTTKSARLSDSIRVQPREGFISYLEAFDGAVATLKTLGMCTTFDVGDGKIAENVLRRKIAEGMTWGNIQTNELDLQFGVVAAHEICFMKIEEKRPRVVENWDDWMQPFSLNEGLIQAWISSVDYDFWQNADDPMLYDSAGRDYSRLPMRPNNLPPPLSRMEIDTSANPGRWLFHRGYIEAVGSVMWLTNLFWKRVGEDRKNRLLGAEWLQVRELKNDVLRIQAAENCFVDESTADVQNKLRVLLYG